MAVRVDQLQLHLQRRVGELAHDLRLGGDLGGHQVQDQDLQRADVLGKGALTMHDEDIFVVEGIVSRQGLGDDQRHSSYS